MRTQSLVIRAQIIFAEGNPSEPSALQKVSLSDARFVMVLGDSAQRANVADQISLRSVLAVQAMLSNPSTIAARMGQGDQGLDGASNWWVADSYRGRRLNPNANANANSIANRNPSVRESRQTLRQRSKGRHHHEIIELERQRQRERSLAASFSGISVGSLAPRDKKVPLNKSFAGCVIAEVRSFC